MDNEAMKTAVMTAMETARVDEGHITSEAEHNIRVCEMTYNIGLLQGFVDDSNLNSKRLISDNSMIKRFTEVFTWYSQGKAEGKILPDGAIFPGYNPETHTKLKADDPENCQEYREYYVKMIVPQAAMKVIERFNKSQQLYDIETIKPETVTAIADLVSAALSVVTRPDVIEYMKPDTAAEFADLVPEAQKVANRLGMQA